MPNAAQRKEYSKERLARVLRLKKQNHRKWIIKAEQIKMVMNRLGKRGNHPHADHLYEKYVTPLMGKEDEDE